MSQPDRPQSANPDLHPDSARFEAELKLTLRPVDPPAGFADRVLARAHAASPVPARISIFPVRAAGPWPPRTAWASSAVAAALLAGVLLGQHAQVRQRRQQAEFAQRQFEAGLRITGETLEQARRQLRQAGVLEGD